MPYRKHDIFLSYSRKDKTRIAPLVKAFEEQGWSVWWDHKIPTGVTFDRFIEDNLLDSKMVVVVWSEFSVESDWVRVEAGEGKALGNLMPLKIDNVRIPLAFKRIQTANLTSWKRGEAHEKFELFKQSIWDFIWNLVESEDSKAAYEAYVSRYPNGPMVNEAKEKLGIQTDLPIPPAEETELWDEAKKKKEATTSIQNHNQTIVQNPEKAEVKPSTIYKILHTYKGRDGYLLYPDISPQQDATIRKKLKNIPEDEKIMAYLVTTTFGNLGSGMAFTTKRIIWRNAFGELLGGVPRFGEIPYTQFVETNFKEGPRYDVLMGKDKAFDINGWVDLDKTQLTAILNAIKKLFLKNKTGN